MIEFYFQNARNIKITFVFDILFLSLYSVSFFIIFLNPKWSLPIKITLIYIKIRLYRIKNQIGGAEGN